MTDHYDEYCDMAAGSLAQPPFADRVSHSPESECEEGDSNSHGLPRQILSLGATTAGPPSVDRSGGDTTTQHHPAPPNDAGSTTDCTTCRRRPFDYGAQPRREYSPL